MRGIRKLRHFKLYLFSLITTPYNYFIAKYLWDIKIGKRCSFSGNTIFHRSRNSIIQIGNDCHFISKVRSHNLIGINRPCIINTQSREAIIEIGDGSGFSGTVISAMSSVKIGSNVKCGANTLITDSDWHPEDPRSGKAKPIKIGENVWLGVNVIVLKGVTIGANTVIGAGSIVTKDIPANVVAAGNPCRVNKELK